MNTLRANPVATGVGILIPLSLLLEGLVQWGLDNVAWPSNVEGSIILTVVTGVGILLARYGLQQTTRARADLPHDLAHDHPNPDDFPQADEDEGEGGEL